MFKLALFRLSDEGVFLFTPSYLIGSFPVVFVRKCCDKVTKHWVLCTTTGVFLGSLCGEQLKEKENIGFEANEKHGLKSVVILL